MKVTLLAGGVGAARLLRGLADVVDPRDLTVIVNTGDDEQFYGLHVSPDLDTIVYTLADLAPRVRGWGLKGETFRTLGALTRFYGPAWFQLGDLDLATHIYRTDRLRTGAKLSVVTSEISRALGVKVRVLPASDDPVRTIVHTANGAIAFQDYLVRRRGRPRVSRVSYKGAARARPAPGVLDAIRKADAVIVAPSNPFVSIGPILAVQGIRAALKSAAGRSVAVSPLIGGRAVKGPLAEMLEAMGQRADTTSLAHYYRGLVHTLIVSPGDAKDGSGRRAAGVPRLVEHDILITQPGPARRLAGFALATASAR